MQKARCTHVFALGSCMFNQKHVELQHRVHSIEHHTTLYIVFSTPSSSPPHMYTCLAAHVTIVHGPSSSLWYLGLILLVWPSPLPVHHAQTTRLTRSIAITRYDVVNTCTSQAKRRVAHHQLTHWLVQNTPSN